VYELCSYVLSTVRQFDSVLLTCSELVSCSCFLFEETALGESFALRPDYGLPEGLAAAAAALGRLDGGSWTAVLIMRNVSVARQRS